MIYLSDERKVRRFDNESTLDPALKPILKYTYKTSACATSELSASTSPASSTKADPGESEEKTVDAAQKKIQALEKEFAQLKAIKDEVEHKYLSEKGMRTGAERKLSGYKTTCRSLKTLSLSIKSGLKRMCDALARETLA